MQLEAANLPMQRHKRNRKPGEIKFLDGSDDLNCCFYLD